MRALVCHSYGPPENLTLQETPTLIPDRSQILIDVYAASLNFPDTLQIQGKYQFQPPMPFIPGSEIGGVVRSVGADVKGFAQGDRVMAAPSIGGIAEQVLAAPSAVRHIPDNMDFKTAAGFAMVYTTARGSTPFSRTVIKRLKTLNRSWQLFAAFEDCGIAQCS